MEKTKKSKAFIYVMEVLALIAVFVIGYLIFWTVMSYIYLSEDYRDEVLEGLFANPMNIHCVSYEYLAPEFKDVVSENEYNSLKKDEDILDTYRKLSAVNNSKEPTTDITTDGFRQYAGGRVTINDTLYHVENHIDFKTHWGKIQITRWYVEIIEIEPAPIED